MEHSASDSAKDDAYLHRLGERVREARARHGMTRKLLARDSGVSERYLAQLEGGRGNGSILLLRQIAAALDLEVETLVHDGPEPAVELAHAVALLRRLDPAAQAEARTLLARHFGEADAANRHDRIALVGLRGAGKTTLGRALAHRRGVPFVELDREIEAAAGTPLGVIFDLYGQPGFRRLERDALERTLAAHERFVLAASGGLVSSPGTYERLLSACFTVWLRATPGEHMARVVAQGDLRPMADNRESMADLRRILRGREALYGKADATVDTGGCSVDASVEALSEAVDAVRAGRAPDASEKTAS